MRGLPLHVVVGDAGERGVHGEQAAAAVVEEAAELLVGDRVRLRVRRHRDSAEEVDPAGGGFGTVFVERLREAFDAHDEANDAEAEAELVVFRVLFELAFEDLFAEDELAGVQVLLDERRLGGRRGQRAGQQGEGNEESHGVSPRRGWAEGVTRAAARRFRLAATRSLRSGARESRQAQ